MQRVNHRWDTEQEHAYTEAALLSVGYGPDEGLAPDVVASHLGPRALEYIGQLANGHGRSHVEVFTDELSANDILVFSAHTGLHSVGRMGRVLVACFMEEWTGRS